jgi:ureidoglycolate lyase
MRKVSVKELTLENFKKYGTFSNMINPDAVKFGGGPVEFFRDMEQLELGEAHGASFSVCRVQKRPFIIDVIESHSKCGEANLPLDGDVLMHVAIATSKRYLPFDKIEVFRVPKGTLVTFRPGVWHCAPFAIDKDIVNVMVVLPERTYANDCEFVSIPEEEKIEIDLS